MRSQHDMVLREEQQPLMPYQPVAPLGPPMPMAHEEQVNYLRGLLRNSWLIVIFGLLGVGAAYLYLRNVTPLYRSYSKIYLEPTGPRILNESISAVQRSSYLYTQCELMRSAPILNLAAEMPGIPELRTFEKDKPVSYLRDNLQVDVGRKDDILTVVVESPYAEDAAKIVNAVVDAYQKYQSMEKKTASSDLLSTLMETRKRSDQEMQELGDRMYKFRREHPNLTLETVISLEMQAISSALVQAQLATLGARTQLATGHPKLLAAMRLEEDLTTRYEQALRRTTDLNATASEYQKLATELATKQEFLKRLDERIKEVEVTKDAQQIFNNVQILETALVPYAPSYPRKYRTLASALVAGLLLGAGLALLRDRLDGRMRSVEEIQTMIGLPVLGVVPQMGGRHTPIARAMTVHLDPRSVVAESYRTVRTAVYFGVGNSRSKTLLLTSPEPGDGKTTTASNLAIAIAQTGRSVLLLDADFRKPTQHKNLDVKDAIGLSSVLAGREPLSKAVQHTGVQGLDILPCGPIPANPSEILNSREFGELVETLGNQYDHIIFDSPPVNAVTDARILGAVCDATIMVLRADKSTRKGGEHARNALLAVGARILGVIVNDAPKRKGYGVYGGSYYGQSDVVVRSADAYSAAEPVRSVPSPALEVGK